MFLTRFEIFNRHTATSCTTVLCENESRLFYNENPENYLIDRYLDCVCGGGGGGGGGVVRFFKS